ncbi:MAG: hypothetical protein IKH50_07560 [Oscillospiraceae bacterium]|nr:hypothetical protein [Oscillospiraceae bacterium]
MAAFSTAVTSVTSVISADDSFIQIGLESHSEHNCAFLKNTADGWKLFDLD